MWVYVIYSVKTIMTNFGVKYSAINQLLPKKYQVSEETVEQVELGWKKRERTWRNKK